jgi:hypothetical protein
MSAARTAVALLAALATAGCGGGKDAKSPSASAPAGTTAAGKAPASGGTAEVALRAYFTALNAGDVKTICALEDDTLERFKYNSTGAACLKDAANSTPQPALPSGDQITIVDRAETPTTANFTVHDQKGASIHAQLVRESGTWFVHVFT